MCSTGIELLTSRLCSKHRTTWAVWVHSLSLGWLLLVFAWSKIFWKEFFDALLLLYSIVWSSCFFVSFFSFNIFFVLMNCCILNRFFILGTWFQINYFDDLYSNQRFASCIWILVSFLWFGCFCISLNALNWLQFFRILRIQVIWWWFSFKNISLKTLSSFVLDGYWTHNLQRECLVSRPLRHHLAVPLTVFWSNLTFLIKNWNFGKMTFSIDYFERTRWF